MRTPSFSFSYSSCTVQHAQRHAAACTHQKVAQHGLLACCWWRQWRRRQRRHLSAPCSSSRAHCCRAASAPAAAAATHWPQRRCSPSSAALSLRCSLCTRCTLAAPSTHHFSTMPSPHAGAQRLAPRLGWSARRHGASAGHVDGPRARPPHQLLRAYGRAPYASGGPGGWSGKWRCRRSRGRLLGRHQWRVWRHGARGSAHEQPVSECVERRTTEGDFGFLIFRPVHSPNFRISGLKLYIRPCFEIELSFWRGVRNAASGRPHSWLILRSGRILRAGH